MYHSVGARPQKGNHVGELSVNGSYSGADKSLARAGRKQATATEDLVFIYHIYNHNWRNISTIYIYRVSREECARFRENVP